MSIIIHPEVLFNISTHVLSNRSNSDQANQKQYIGILLGTYNTRTGITDISDSFETIYEGQADQLTAAEESFLKERISHRMQGDQWNLFKYLEIVGCYITQTSMEEKNIGLHQSIGKVVADNLTSQSNLFKIFLTFNPETKQEKLYQRVSENGQFQLTPIDYVLELSMQEMISIGTVQQQQYQQTGKHSIGQRLQYQLNTVKQYEQLLQELLHQLNDPQIENDLILQRNINEILNSFPQSQTSEREQLLDDYLKINYMGHFCLLQSMQQQVQQIKEIQKGKITL